MIKILLVRWAIVSVAIAIVAAIMPSIDVEGGFFGLIGVALVFGLVNALIGPVLRLVSLPLTLITFGLFGLVVNALLLAISAGLLDNLDVGGFLATIVAAFLISVLTAVMVFAVPDPANA
ncbi:MAG TPA: phage holin family protein [Nocardioidaceae bacterium]|nr:phage holin family protein [Nocardioidaceae bacterium]